MKIKSLFNYAIPSKMNIVPLRDAVIAGFCIFFASLIGLYSLWNTANKELLHEVQQDLLLLTSAAASVVDGDLHEKLIDPKQMDGELYNKVLEPLRAIHKRVPKLAYIYTLRLQKNKVVFVVDTEIPVKNRNWVDTRPRLGEVYKAKIPKMMEALTRTDKKLDPIASEPYSDKWGSFITGYAPIFNSRGDQVAIIGLDITQDSYNERIACMRKSLFYGLIPIVLISILLGYVVYRLREQILNDFKEQSDLLSLFNQGESVLFRWNNDYRWSINYVSANIENLLGYTKEELAKSKKKYASFIHKDDLHRVFDKVQRAKLLKKDILKHEPYRIVTKYGEIKWILDYTVIQRDEDGKITHFLGYIIDITKQQNRLKNLEKFIEKQDNIVILSDREQITFANKKFFEFLGFQDLAHFKEKYSCIGELFIENEKSFHLRKIPANANWVDFIQTLPHTQRIVFIMAKNNSIHSFSVTINQFDENLFIINFTNISQTIRENIKLEEKTIKDKLTGAYNREYFEKNYASFIDFYTRNGYQLALAIIDIDHFKEVNDTYGHDVGDEVLIKFVDTLHKYSRTDDILIRWGGEEFVLILKAKSEAGLKKALEHLRKVIEIEPFPTIGHKTCSIGGTIYQNNENIEATIKRADEALYDAKNSGRNKTVIK